MGNVIFQIITLRKMLLTQCLTNQLTGFYMRATLALNGLISPNFLMQKFFGEACRNCPFPKYLHTRKLVEITLFYAVIRITKNNKNGEISPTSIPKAFWCFQEVKKRNIGLKWVQLTDQKIIKHLWIFCSVITSSKLSHILFKFRRSNFDDGYGIINLSKFLIIRQACSWTTIFYCVALR